MVAVLALFVLAYALAALPAVRLAGKRITVTVWDLAFPFSGPAAWVVFERLGLGGTAGASNYVLEMFGVAAVSLASSWGFWAVSFLSPGTARIVSRLITLVPILTALMARLVVPTLPY